MHIEINDATNEWEKENEQIPSPVGLVGIGMVNTETLEYQEWRKPEHIVFS
ncbi:MAG: hypothetical protein Roseis2KO_21370 [Roseivirga sp.]